jgi:pyruvate dehydrogenase E2 component (dihydrolipoamide acetyltransferase)
MATQITFTLPPTGEVQDQARLVSWQVQPGQTFAAGDVLLEIETDKSVIEIPAAQAGKVIEHLAAADAVITIKTPLARLEIEGQGEAPAPTRPAAAAEAVSHVVEFRLPPTGEVQDSARLVSWQVQTGQTFTEGEVLLEIETDKSVIEIPAPCDGRLLEQLAAVDAVIDGRTVLARLEVEGAASVVAEKPGSTVPAAPVARPPAPSQTPALRSATATAAPTAANPSRALATPAARAAMRSLRSSAHDVQGSGPAGRVTLADVARAAPGRSGTSAADPKGRVSTRHGELQTRIWEPVGRVAGTATIVLIHGMFADIDAWASLALSLSRAGQRVVAIDLPGHGRSSAAVTRLDEVVDAVDDALQQLPGERRLLVGHSFGGAVAARLACRPALAAQALVLIAPMGLGTEIEQRFLQGVTHARNDETLGRELAKLTRSGIKPTDAYLSELRGGIAARRELLLELTDAISWDGVQQVSVAADLHKALCPITVLHGRSDAIIPWQHALNAPAQAALHLIPDVGHMPQWEAATLTTDAILRATRAA